MTIEFKPHSLFGRHGYAHEQFIINLFIRQVDQTIAMVEPEALGVGIPFEKLPEEWRKRKIRIHLGKAKEILNELGV
jgi:hypothetical protein